MAETPEVSGRSESQSEGKMPERVLIVDDDENILDSYRRRLKRALEVEVCSDPIEALTRIQGPTEYAVVISDFMMPKMNGIQLLKHCKEHSPNSVRMMLTGVGDFSTSVEAVNSGSVFRFLIKPCAPETLARALVDSIRHYRLVVSQESLLRDTLRESVRLVNEIASFIEPITFAQVQRLSALVEAVARDLDPERAAEIEIAWLLSGLGILTMPADVLERRNSGAVLGEHEVRAFERVSSFSSRIAERLPNMEFVNAALGDEQTRGAGLVDTDAVQRARAILEVFTAFAGIVGEHADPGSQLAALRESGASFDPAVMKALERQLESHGPGVGLFPVEIPLEELQPGDTLGADIQTAEGTVLAASGTCMSFLSFERIRNFATFVRIEEPLTVLRQDVVIEVE